jgi:hypothetical protein
LGKPHNRFLQDDRSSPILPGWLQRDREDSIGLLIRAYASNTSSLNPSATDPGDIVFALIGLTYDAKIHGMNPDSVGR